MRAADRDWLGGAAWLGASGIASAASLLVLASNRLPGLGASEVTPMLLAILWHFVGLTLALFGIDYALFAILSRRRDATFHLASSLGFPVLPCLAAFSIASLALFSPLQVVILAVAVFADTVSTFRQSEFNAKRLFSTSAAGAFMNYPVFVAVWWMVARDGTSLTEGLGAFAISSLLRCGWFEARHRMLSHGAAPVQLTVKGLIGTQGALNMLLFRSDQLALAVMHFTLLGALALDAMLPAYVFLARIPELATGFVVLLGTLFFPSHPLEPGSFRTHARFYTALAAAAALGTAIAAAILVPTFAGPRPDLAWCIPFVAQVPLILLANLGTYSMQSANHLPGLVRNLTISCMAGAVLVAMAALQSSLLLLVWTVPLQLAVFFTLVVAAPWGRRVAAFTDTKERAREVG